MAGEKKVDDVTGVETTGHEWDGIAELNNPLPRWWLWIFYATIAWAAIYMIFMPAIPGLPGAEGATRGLRDHSERANVVTQLAVLEEARAPFFEQLAATPIDQLEANPDLLNFALAAGESAFGDNCATCHGAGGQGATGYPNLNDDAWLWGGELSDIKQTIRFGIRNAHPETRFSQMPAFGRDGLLERAQINDLVELVIQASGGDADATAAARVEGLYAEQCATCHGADYRGDQFQGAPNLTDADWLYGGDREAIYDTIYNSRYGVMPYFAERLDQSTIDALAIYVAALDGDLTR